MKLSVPTYSPLQFVRGSLPILILFPLSQSRLFAAQDTCNTAPPASTYRFIAGDLKDLRHLQLARDFNAKGTLEIKICAGEVRIFPSQDRRIHLNVDLQKTPPSDITAFVRKIESNDN
ncbi:hypothetical protein BDD14_1979 [Edaphobacter modestus]|uniref:Uncharacterized protein n=1 Tax=Edaphobacter modestus TaxID=388466 RepID=A0A4Q7YU91_9BACT|nr:hypothetical protein BDD14_1979 [Edaphobacter modestus]